MKARIINQPENVYSQTDANSPIIAQLAIGIEIELGVLKKNNGKDWVTVTLPDGRQGYMPGQTQVFLIKLARLIQESVNIYSAPSVQSPLKGKYIKNAVFYIADSIKQNNIVWVKIRDFSGNEGYIDWQTRVLILPPNETNCDVCNKKPLYGERTFVITAISEKHGAGINGYTRTADFHRISVFICDDCKKNPASFEKAVVNKDVKFGRSGNFKYWQEQDALEIFKNIWKINEFKDRGFVFMRDILKDELEDNSPNKTTTLIFHAKNHFLIEPYPGRLYIDGILLAFTSYGKGFDIPIKVIKGKHVVNIVVGQYRLNQTKGFPIDTQENTTYEFDCNIDRLMGGVKLVPRLPVH